MNPRERMLTLRLLEKIDGNCEFANQIGIEIVFSEADSESKELPLSR